MFLVDAAGRSPSYALCGDVVDGIGNQIVHFCDSVRNIIKSELYYNIAHAAVFLAAIIVYGKYHLQPLSWAIYKQFSNKILRPRAYRPQKGKRACNSD